MGIPWLGTGIPQLRAGIPFKGTSISREGKGNTFKDTGPSRFRHTAATIHHLVPLDEAWIPGPFRATLELINTRGPAMGVTIHFEGRLLNEAAYDRAIERGSRVAAKHGWHSEPLAEESATLERVRNEENWDYQGPTRGLAIYPHPSCEPLRLEFDIELYVQEYIKTQFAPPEIHAVVIELLDQIAPEFEALSIVDEGEYFETRDMTLLTTHMAACFAAMRDEMAKDPTLEGPVRLKSGRIADLVRG